MKTEKIINKSSSKCINVVANHVESLRINNDVENTIRVYDNGMIGVEGCLGTADFEQMEKSATAKLAQGIAYPETHDKPIVASIDACKKILSEQEFVGKIEKLLTRLEKENPQFLFNNKIKLDESYNSYSNSDGSDLQYKGNQFICSLTIKFKGSANIMDESYGCESDYFDEDQICRDVKLICDAYLNTIPQVEEDEVTVIGDFEPLQYAISHFIADMYYNKASMFDGKLGQKLFNDKLNVTLNRDPKRQINLKFFDTEGVVNPDYTNYIVKNGVFEHTITCKKSAAQYGTEVIGASGAGYNDVPSITFAGLDITPTADSLSQIVKGKAVYISVTSGGDMTPSGDFSLPVMSAYLYEDGKLLGRLPEFAVSGNLYDVAGKDFIGVVESGLFKFGRHSHFVYKAKLANKQK